jgi:adenine-specific DNA-methyltransferase
MSETRAHLLALCKEKGLRGYSNKNKNKLIELLQLNNNCITSMDNSAANIAVDVAVDVAKSATLIGQNKTEYDEIIRLNYIGSKYQLLDWLTDAIKCFTGLKNFKNYTIADLFAGTGIISYHFRNLGAHVVANDAEIYSSIIAHAFAVSQYNKVCADFIMQMNDELTAGKHKEVVGYITRCYSPYADCKRMFFTVENAQRIDYVRIELEKRRENLSDNDLKFLLASLIVSADAISNVPAVYGCYLKNYKAKALKLMNYKPIHTNSTIAATGSKVYNMDILNADLLTTLHADIVYLDPPYNERQYSKNYFPLNMIISPSAEELKGKTGIPEECFLSPFCRRGEVESAFNALIAELVAGKTKWIFISYNSESLLSREKMIELLSAFGEVEVIERDYKRFKSFEYNEDTAIREYLFCLRAIKK